MRNGVGITRISNYGNDEFTCQKGWVLADSEEVIELEHRGDADVGVLPELPSSLTTDQTNNLMNVLNDFFIDNVQFLKGTNKIKHEIMTEGGPIRQPSRRQNPKVREEEEHQVNLMLRDGIIKPSSSPWASPHCFSKKERRIPKILC